METAAMNLSFINVITENTKILEILNNTSSEDRAELCLNSIVPHLKIQSDEIDYDYEFSRVTYVDIIEFNENNLVMDIECEIVVYHDKEGEDVIPKINDFIKAKEKLLKRDFEEIKYIYCPN